jgi:hypothetical protein
MVCASENRRNFTVFLYEGVSDEAFSKVAVGRDLLQLNFAQTFRIGTEVDLGVTAEIPVPDREASLTSL